MDNNTVTQAEDKLRVKRSAKLWTDFFVNAIDVILDEEERNDEKVVARAAAIADRALEAFEQRWAGIPPQ